MAVPQRAGRASRRIYVLLVLLLVFVLTFGAAIMSTAGARVPDSTPTSTPMERTPSLPKRSKSGSWTRRCAWLRTRGLAG